MTTVTIVAGLVAVTESENGGSAARVLRTRGTPANVVAAKATIAALAAAVAPRIRLDPAACGRRRSAAAPRVPLPIPGVPWVPLAVTPAVRVPVVPLAVVPAVPASVGRQCRERGRFGGGLQFLAWGRWHRRGRPRANSLCPAVVGSRAGVFSPDTRVLCANSGGGSPVRFSITLRQWLEFAVLTHEGHLRASDRAPALRGAAGCCGASIMARVVGWELSQEARG